MIYDLFNVLASFRTVEKIILGKCKGKSSKKKRLSNALVDIIILVPLAILLTYEDHCTYVRCSLDWIIRGWSILHEDNVTIRSIRWIWMSLELIRSKYSKCKRSRSVMPFFRTRPWGFDIVNNYVHRSSYLFFFVSSLTFFSDLIPKSFRYCKI